ncbi:hypothetical protein CAPTEDRAFT_173009 [Capitella teleta]|uniref:Protein kinase domain-containing protein n=1 Tax=Capitella teleta TaxID=283909 RepID=R7V637_CAPTE|nr:hypothetical protein CAPTEDRAFT_173009 [Capitella teleta]|eukprot:ELU14044.1 hypothetical protein CAPTEDRAFT_173009 [Capitella teleta]
MKFYLRRVHKGDIRLGSGTTEPSVADMRDHLLSLAVDVASGMRHLASRGIVHRELAAKHVMVDAKHVAKVAGLNSLKGAVVSDVIPEPLSQRWLAPEVIENNASTLKSDIWSYGVTLWEIMNKCQHRPYTEMGSKDVYLYIKSGQRLTKPPACEKAVYALMKKCWSLEQNDRPDFVRVSDSLKELLYSGEHGNKATRMGSLTRRNDLQEISIELSSSVPSTIDNPPNANAAETPIPTSSNASPVTLKKQPGEVNQAFESES